MNNNLFFLIISCVSICFTIIVICNGPVINHFYGSSIENCKALSDEYDYYKKEGALTDSYEKSQKKK